MYVSYEINKVTEKMCSYPLKIRIIYIQSRSTCKEVAILHTDFTLTSQLVYERHAIKWDIRKRTLTLFAICSSTTRWC